MKNGRESGVVYFRLSLSYQNGRVLQKRCLVGILTNQNSSRVVIHPFTRGMKYSILYWIFCAVTGGLIVLCATAHSLVGYIFWISLWIAGKWIARFFIFRRAHIEDRFNNKETALVTGASCGIGAQIAKSLCERGGKVIWTARDVDKAQRVLNDIRWTYYHGGRGYVLYLDLASKIRIRQFVEEFKKREKKLNCIILNAAYHGSKRITVDGFEQTIAVNHLGHMYLVYLLLDMLKESAPSRIVVVSSDLHRLVTGVKLDDLMYEKDYSPFGAYNHSKVLNILFVRELARRLKGTGVTVYSAHPGTPIRSELMRDSWLGGVLFDQLVHRPLAFVFCRTAYEGAQTAVYCACAKDIENDTGKYYENLREAKPSSVASDDATASRLWDQSCDLLEIKRDWV